MLHIKPICKKVNVVSLLKTTLLSLVLSLHYLGVHAQVFPVQIDIQISPPYQLELEKYTEYEFNVIATLTNTTMERQRLRFTASMTGDNGITAETDPNSKPPEAFILEPMQTRVLSGSQIADLYIGFTEENIDITGVDEDLRKYILFNRVLPEGNYELCVRAFQYDGQQPLSEGSPLGCSNLEIIFPDRPILNNPIDRDNVPENPTSTINFSWFPPGTVDINILSRTEYTLKLVDMSRYPGVDPTEAMLDPTVDFVLLEPNIEITSFLAEDLDLQVGHAYAARVTASDSEGTIAYQFDGHSEVIVFTYGNLDLEAPEIITPGETSYYDAEGDVFIEWEPPNFNELAIDGEIQYIFEFVERESEEDIHIGNFSDAVSFEYEMPTVNSSEGTSSITLDRNGFGSVFETGKHYWLRMQVKSEIDNAMQFQNDGYSNIRHFEVGDASVPYLSPPSITTPSEESIYAADSDVFLEWTPPNFEERAVSGRIIYQFEFVQKENEAEEIEADNFSDAVSFEYEMPEVASSDDVRTFAFERATLGSSFEANKYYAVRMKVKSAIEGGMNFQNDGYSNIAYFLYGDPPPEDDTAEDDGPPPADRDPGDVVQNESTDCDTGCDRPLSNTTAVATIPDEISGFYVGFFGVFNLTDVVNRRGKMSGKGYVRVNFLLDAVIKVEFSNVQLNANNEMIRGTVKAVDDNSFLVSDINGEISDNLAKIKATAPINKWLTENASEGRIIAPHLIDRAWEALGVDEREDRALGMPIGYQRELLGHDMLIGITEMVFEPTTARVKLVYEHQFEELGSSNWLALAGQVCMTPSGFGKEFMLHLNRDLTLEDFGEEDQSKRDIKFKLKGKGGSLEQIRNGATFIEFECDCVKAFSLRMEAEFDSETLLKDEEDGDIGTGPVKAYFNFDLRREGECGSDEDEEVPEFVEDRLTPNNFMVEFSMDPFQIKGLDGWGFKLDKGYVDFSTIENPEGIDFPDDYEHAAFSPPEGASSSDAAALGNTWTGFYMKDISIRAPKDLLHSDTMQRPEIGIHDLFIDDTGFTGDIVAENIINIGQGSMDSCYFSVEEFRLKIVQNVFRSGQLKGDFGIPVTDENTPYEAVLAYKSIDEQEESSSGSEEEAEDEEPASEWGFFMSIKPRGELAMPALIGTAHLEDNSYVHLKYGTVSDDVIDDSDYVAERKGIALYLVGKMDFGTNLIGASDVAKEGSKTNTPFSFSQMEFEMLYNSVDGFDFEYGFASPQKYMGGLHNRVLGEGEEEGGMSGFPVSIEEVDCIPKFDWEEKCIGFLLKFEVRLNLMDDNSGGFRASTVMNLGASWNGKLRRFQFDSLMVKCIQVGYVEGEDDDTDAAATTSSTTEESTESGGVTFKGKVCFYNNDEYCGKEGVSGVRGSLVVGLPMATVRLDAMFAATDTFRFWYVDGMAISNTDKPLASLGTLDLIGLGGGIYYNMKVNAGGEEDDKGYNKAMVGKSAGFHTAEDVNKAAKVKKGTIDFDEGGYSIDEDDCATSSGFTVSPHEGSYIFKVSLALATAGDHSMFNMDVSVNAAVEENRGLTYFSIIGDGYIMAKVDEREKAPIKADIEIEYHKLEDRENFHAGFDIYVDFKKGDYLTIEGIDRGFVSVEEAISEDGEEEVDLDNRGPGVKAFDGKLRSRFVGAHFNLTNYFEESEEDSWSFKMGGPGGADQMQPGGLMLDLAGIVKAKARNYFQVGNDIDQGFMELPKLIRDIFSGASEGGESGKRGSISGGDRFTEGMRGFQEDLGGSKEGFIMGFSTEVEIDVDAFLIYAHFGMAMGFDINMMNYGTGSYCTTNSGEIINPVGLDGWYATGQMYAGIEGEVGIQVEFFGEHKISLFRLGAAFQIQGGFPNPVWAEGRAAVRYAVLGDLFSGEAHFNFAVGEKCRPLTNDPFGIAVINEVLPGKNAKNVDPYVQPQISFNIPIDEVFKVPEIIEEGDEEIVVVHEYLPQIGRYRNPEKGMAPDLYIYDLVKERFVEMEGEGYAFNSDHTALTVKPKETLNESRFELKLGLRALEKMENGRWINLYVKEDGGGRKLWKEDTIVVFSTKAIGETLESRMIKDANPIVNQRYYLKDAPKNLVGGKMEFWRSSIVADYFYPSKGNSTYSYKAKFHSMEGTAPLVSDIRISDNKIHFDVPPAIQNDMIYNLQIVREKSRTVREREIGNVGFNPGSQSTSQANIFFNENGFYHLRKTIKSDNAYFEGLSNNIDFVSRARKLVPGSYSEDHEEIVYKYAFKTSKYNTLEEKLQTAEVSLENRETGAYEFSSEEAWVELSLDEHFDIYDMFGFTKSYGVNSYTRVPLVALMPKFEGSYWNNKGKAIYKNMLGFLAHMNYNNRYKQEKYNRQIFNDEGRSLGFVGFENNLRTPEINLYVNASPKPIKHSYNPGNLSRLEQVHKLNYRFLNGDSSKPFATRFRDIDPSTIRRGLTEAEIQSAWDAMVDERLQQLDQAGSGSSSKGLGSMVANNSMQKGGKGKNKNPFSNLLNKDSENNRLNQLQSKEEFMNSLATKEIPMKVYFRYDFHDRIFDDVNQFKQNLAGMHHFNLRVSDITPDVINLGYVQREILKENYEDYRIYYNRWMMINPQGYLLKNNPGTYKFEAKYLLYDLNGNVAANWLSPSINFNINND